MTDTTADDLPPLPAPALTRDRHGSMLPIGPCFTADQMRAYALAARASLAAPAAPAQAEPQPVNAQMLEALRQCVAMLERADCSTGYCCCGSKVDSHGMGDGHSPVDEGDHYQCHALEQARLAITAAEAPQPEPVNAQMLKALRKCKTCSLATEVRDLVNAAIAVAEAAPAPVQAVTLACPYCGEPASEGWTPAQVRAGFRYEDGTKVYHCRLAAD